MQGEADGECGRGSAATGGCSAASWPDEGVTRVAEMATGRVLREIRAVAGATVGHGLQPGRGADRPGVGQTCRTPPSRSFDIESGAGRSSTSAHRFSVHDVAWSPDGASIATSAEGSAHIWDASTGQRRIALLGHQVDVK